MRTLPKFLLAIFLLTVASVGWAAECPEGYKNDYKGDCVVAPVETIYYDNGVYKGQTRGGQRHGQGTYTWSNGEKYIGQWKDHKQWSGVYYDRSGNVKGTYSAGVFRSTPIPNAPTDSGQVWCAHSGGVALAFAMTCKAWEGKGYSEK